jgi:cell division protein DivIC
MINLVRMKLIKQISSWLRNKYLVALCIFAVIILFFDKNDLFTQLARTKQLKQLQQSKGYYAAEIAREQKELEKLRSDPGTLERYAREKYLMKRENEDLFLVPEKPRKIE